MTNIPSKKTTTPTHRPDCVTEVRMDNNFFIFICND